MSSFKSVVTYVGWTEPGEWFNIIVDAAQAGTYAADFLYTSNRGGTISVDVNGREATGPLQVPTTYDSADPVAWRQWHHWNLAPKFCYSYFYYLLIEVSLGIQNDFVGAGLASQFCLLTSGSCCDDLGSGILCHLSQK